MSMITWFGLVAAWNKSVTTGGPLSKALFSVDLRCAQLKQMFNYFSQVGSFKDFERSLRSLKYPLFHMRNSSEIRKTYFLVI